MAAFTSKCEIIINKPTDVVYDFITHVSNWIGRHEACQGINDPSQNLDQEAVPGFKFTEAINVRGNAFEYHWEVRKALKNQYFEFSMTTDFILPPVYNTIIMYVFDPVDNGEKTRCIRTMINCTNADYTAQQKIDFEDTSMHVKFLEVVKEQLESQK